VWIDVGERNSELVLRSYSVEYWAAGLGSWQGSAFGRSDDWIPIEDLRSSKATFLKSGESVARLIRLEDVDLRSGRATIDLVARIFGTQNLADPNVRTYEPKATLALVLRRTSRCIEVRRLTSR